MNIHTQHNKICPTLSENVSDVRVITSASMLRKRTAEEKRNKSRRKLLRLRESSMSRRPLVAGKEPSEIPQIAACADALFQHDGDPLASSNTGGHTAGAWVLYH